MSSAALRFSRRSALPVLLQTEAAECGLACLAMVASYHGRQTDLTSLRRDHPASLRGTSLKSLMLTASQLGLSCRPLRIALDELCALRTPAILHWDATHFVVLRSASRRGIVVHNPALGRRTYSLREASPHLTGVALELLPMDGFEPGPSSEKLHLADLWRHASGLKGALAQLFVVSLVLQVFALAGPFYMQLVVDEGLARRDRDLLSLLALAFVLLMLIHLGTRALRSWLVLRLGTELGFQIVSNLFHHLLRLPISYFEKRHLGDVVSRFGSLEPITRLFTTGLVTVGIDGLMALATLAMILAYSPVLSSVVLASVTLYWFTRIAFYAPLKDLSEEQIVAGAREDSSVFETLRALQSIEVFGCESDREVVWQNRHAAQLNAGVRLGRLAIGQDAIRGVLFGLENVAVIYLGATLVLSHELTVGMLFAFMSYKGQFTTRLSALIDQAIELRMLDLHLARVADIALTRAEDGSPANGSRPRRVDGCIELVDLGFRYAASDPPVLEGLNLTIERGQSIAITGPSGCGKTTLIKLLLGLLSPSSGEVRVDGTRLDQLGLSTYRHQIAAVMQNDQLLSGSIADNICLFDVERDADRIRSCAETAAIHREIASMPMQYDSQIGDMGSMLSAGQRQRVLLARALYREPRVLFLDEWTSNLDARLEAQINEEIGRLDVTRVVITHRAELIGSMDHELALEPTRIIGDRRASI